MYVLCMVYRLENISLRHDGYHHRDGRQYVTALPVEYFITAFHSNDIPTRRHIYYFHVK